MKKTSKLFILAAMAAVVFSCSKEKQFDSDINVQEGNNPGKAVVPAVDGNRLTSFKYTLENPGTKVDVNLVSGLTNIEDGDKVLVFVGEDNKSVYEYDLVNNKFVLNSGDGVVLSSPASVFYPADEFAADGANVKFTMPAAIEASGDLGSINPMAGIIEGSSGSYTVELKNVASVLRVKVIADENITSVKLDYGTDVKYASGSKFIVDASAITMAATDASSNTFETCSIATPAKSADVLFMVPTISLTNGLTITANLDGAASSRSISRTAYTPVRNKISGLEFRAFFSGGMGTEDNPYKIADARDFKNIQKLIENGFSAEFDAAHFQEAYYKQTANIDFENATLTSIGVYNATPSDATPFKGVYDGDGKTLSKFIVTGTKDNSTGLFEYVDGATLQNIEIGTCSVTGPNTTGILTGRCIGNTTIENCSLTGPANVTGRNSVGFIAHIVGNTLVKACTVSDLTVITAASGADANNQGGVVGFAGGASKIEYCGTIGDIQFTGTASGAARGGIVGKFDSTGQVKECINTAAVTNGLVGSTGGIAGQLTNGTILSCANTANVSGTSMVGGIVGFAGTTKTDGEATNITFITSCRNAANVTGTANCVGGIAGKLQNGAVMSACYAQGNVTTSTYDVGGLTGLIQINNNNATSRIYVYDCIANMNVTSERTSNACRTGGAVGNITIGTTGQYVAMDNCGVLDVTITAGGEYVGGFAGWMTGDATNTNRARIRNCYTLVSSVPGSAKKGGFIGAVSNKAELRYDYFVADDSSDISTATTANYSKKTAAEIQSDATCTTFNGNNFILKVGGTDYSSALGWAMTNGYPVPGALISLGSEYYK